ncbi:MAG: dimethylargininase [Gammaproteobacteria bacterium]|nr:dimethylargininase [Gammaproteobacteria bacterium]
MNATPGASLPTQPKYAPIAVTRKISSAMMRCELTHLQRTAIDVALAREQHHAYEQALRALGCRIESLPEEPQLADSVFVEDTAIVLDEVAVITRPGAASRRPETASIAAVLAKHRDLVRIESPGTLDGGDVLRLQRTLYVGVSGRSSASGIAQLGALLLPFGYRVVPVAVQGCLHLKSAVTQVAGDRLLINSRYVERSQFPGMRFIEVDESEPLGANALMLGSGVIYSSSHPRTAGALRRHGIRVHPVEMSETEKAEGAVTCCSLLFAS